MFLDKNGTSKLGDMNVSKIAKNGQNYGWPFFGGQMAKNLVQTQVIGALAQGFHPLSYPGALHQIGITQV